MEIRPEDLIYARERFIPAKKSLEPKIDEEISKIVGKKVLALDPRLTALVLKHKKMGGVKIGRYKDALGKEFKVEEPDNLLLNPEFIKELKEIFG